MSYACQPRRKRAHSPWERAVSVVLCYPHRQLHCCTIGDWCASRLRPPVISQSNHCPWYSQNGHPNPFISKDESMSESVCQVSVKVIKQVPLYSWRWLNFACNWSVLFLKDCPFESIIEGKGMQLACCGCLILNQSDLSFPIWEHGQPFPGFNPFIGCQHFHVFQKRVHRQLKKN